jgi:hypothetical protein
MFRSAFAAVAALAVALTMVLPGRMRNRGESS